MSSIEADTKAQFRPGLKFDDWECVITRAHQAEKLACCGLDPTLHGDRIDITHLAYSAVMAVRRAGISVNGRVHMSQFFDLREPVLLDEPLRVRGEVIAVTSDRRGEIEESRFDFLRPDGSIPLSTRRKSLILDPTVGAARKPAGGTPRSAPDPRDGKNLIARHQLIPENVAAYSGDAENLIHSDPEAARQFGFRAPIAAGLMAVHFMMAALCRPAPPDRLRMTVRFRRPMFWDELLDVWGDHRPGDNDSIAALAVVNPEGKVANDCVVDEIGYTAAI